MIILPSYIGIIINHYKDPYWPSSIVESRKVFFVAHLYRWHFFFFGWSVPSWCTPRRALLKVAYGKAAVGDTENGGVRGSWPQMPVAEMIADSKSGLEVIYEYTHIYIYVGYCPLPLTVTTRGIIFVIGDSYKPSFATVTGRGHNPIYMRHAEAEQVWLAFPWKYNKIHFNTFHTFQ